MYLPAVITVTDAINIPRVPNIYSISFASKSEIIVWNESDIEADTDRIGIVGSPTVVRRILEPKKKEKKKREVKLNMKSVDSRIDLRGMDSEEACYRTDKYLDEAYLGNLGEVTIVHGKGTGILRKAINDMLKRHPHVKSYRLGVYGEGGDGVTIVELK